MGGSGGLPRTSRSHNAILKKTLTRCGLSPRFLLHRFYLFSENTKQGFKVFVSFTIVVINAAFVVFAIYTIIATSKEARKRLEDRARDLFERMGSQLSLITHGRWSMNPGSRPTSFSWGSNPMARDPSVGELSVVSEAAALPKPPTPTPTPKLDGSGNQGVEMRSLAGKGDGRGRKLSTV